MVRKIFDKLTKPGRPRSETTTNEIGQDIVQLLKQAGRKNCHSCDLVNANLSGADLSEAGLSSANLG